MFERVEERKDSDKTQFVIKVIKHCLFIFRVPQSHYPIPDRIRETPAPRAGLELHFIRRQPQETTDGKQPLEMKKMLIYWKKI